MEVNKLPGVVLMLVMVGMVLGIGVITFEKFGGATATTTTITNEAITWVADQDNVSVAKGNITTFSQITNSTGAVYPSANYTVTLVTGRIQNFNTTSTAGLPCHEGDTCYADYTYTESDTETNSVMSSMINSTGTISSTWLPLIVIILALAIIMVLVIRSFGGNRR